MIDRLIPLVVIGFIIIVIAALLLPEAKKLLNKIKLIRMLLGSDGQVLRLLGVIQESKVYLRSCEEYAQGRTKVLPKGIMKAHGIEMKAVESSLKKEPKILTEQTETLLQKLRKNIESL